MEPGSVVAHKYLLERLLGEGGMGSVWLATNQVLQKRVALKLMSQRFASVPEASERFLREGVATSRVTHPSIVQVFDAGQHDGQPWLAMELLEGETLAQRLARGVLSLDETLHLGRGVLSALWEVHSVGIVHRDLKPDNLFLSRNRDGSWAPKILDFGVAKDTSGTELSKLTVTGAVVGTAFYLSPEQAKCLPDIDARTDLYAIGVVLFESLSGQHPYEATTITQLVAKMFTESPRRLLDVAPHLPPSMSDVVAACLHPDRDKRFQSARALLSALEAAVSSVAPDTRARAAFAPTALASSVSAADVRSQVAQTQGLPPASLHAQSQPAISPAPSANDMPPRSMPTPMPAADVRAPQRSSSALGLVALVLALFLLGGAATGTVVWLGSRDRGRPVARPVLPAVPQPAVTPSPVPVPPAPPSGIDPPVVPVVSPDPTEPDPEGGASSHAARPRPSEARPRERPGQSGLSQTTVVAIMRAREITIRGTCVPRAAAVDPRVRGVLTVEFTIGPGGVVRETRVVHDGTGNALLSRCVQNQLRLTRFPRAENGQPTEARYPFQF